MRFHKSLPDHGALLRKRNFVNEELSSREGCSQPQADSSTARESFRRYSLHAQGMIGALNQQYISPANLTLDSEVFSQAFGRKWQMFPHFTDG